MMSLDYLFGTLSDRRFVKEIQVNIAYLQFLHIGLTAKVANASTFNQNRQYLLLAAEGKGDFSGIFHIIPIRICLITYR